MLVLVLVAAALYGSALLMEVHRAAAAMLRLLLAKRSCRAGPLYYHRVPLAPRLLGLSASLLEVLHRVLLALFRLRQVLVRLRAAMYKY